MRNFLINCRKDKKGGPLQWGSSFKEILCRWKAQISWGPSKFAFFGLNNGGLTEGASRWGKVGVDPG